MARKRYIYTLTDPLTEEIRYVGCTVNPRRRQSQVNCLFWGRPVIEWAQRLKANGVRPRLDVIEECHGNHAARELYWIKKMLADGCALLNQHGVTMRYSSNHAGVVRGE